jgi:L-arabinonolactonase
MIRIDKISSTSMVLGENPLWDVDEQRIYWVDSIGRKIMRGTADGRDIEAWETPDEIGSMALRHTGGGIIAGGDGLYFIDFKTGERESICDPEARQREVRLNDCKVDSAGRLFVGSLDKTSYNPDPTILPTTRGSLFRLNADLSLHRFDDEFACANGPCWDPLGQRFYISDTLRSTIYTADWDGSTGTFSNKRQFLSCAPGGMPDGATVDSDGYYWSSFLGTGEVRRYSPDGTLDYSITLPDLMVTSVMFGGPALDLIFVTTMSPAPFLGHPQSGELYAVHGTGFRGVAAQRFAG